MSRHQGNRTAPVERGGHLVRSSNLERDSLCEHVSVDLQAWKVSFARSARGGGQGMVELDVELEGEGFTIECRGRARPNDFTL